MCGNVSEIKDGGRKRCFYEKGNASESVRVGVERVEKGEKHHVTVHARITENDNRVTSSYKEGWMLACCTSERHQSAVT